MKMLKEKIKLSDETKEKLDALIQELNIPEKDYDTLIKQLVILCNVRKDEK